MTGKSILFEIDYKRMKLPFFLTSDLSVFLYEKIGFSDYLSAMEYYDGMTREEIAAKVTLLLDEYFSEPLDPVKTGGITQDSLYYETLKSTLTFSVEEGEGRLILPEFFSVERDGGVLLP